jgi:hypothetical protein
VRFRLRAPWVGDPDQQRINDGLVNDLNEIAEFVFKGVGVPSVTPVGAAVYYRLDPTPGAAVYMYDGVAWTVIV